MLFILSSEAARKAMNDIRENEIADQIDREIFSGKGLMSLVICLSATVGLAAAGVANLLGVL